MEDLSRYSVDDLRRMRVLVEKEIDQRREERISKARQEIQQIAEHHGFALSDLLEDIEQQQPDTQ